MPWLLLDPGQSTERAFPIDALAVTIGRGVDETISVQHRSLSRQHARVTREERRTILTDLQSKNGTFVNGARVTRAELRSGDLVRCGEVLLRYAEDWTPGVHTGNGPLPTLICEVPKRALSSIAEMLRAPQGSGESEPVHGRSENLRRDRERLEVLLRVGEMLAEPGELDAILDRILALVFEILEVDRAAILLVDAETGKLSPTAVRSSMPLAQGEQVWSRHIVDLVRELGVAALFGNPRVDPRLASAASVMAQSIRASMCVPLNPRSETIGVLYVDNVTTPERFGEADLKFLAGFANPAAMAIHNARLSRELERRAVLENNLMRFFPSAVRRRLLEAPAALNDAVETEATVLFADISGFTGIAAGMSPREVIALLNDYFPVLAEAVFQHEGTLEKYIGDALLAVWGAPFRSDDDARLALSAAVEMQRGITKLSAAWEPRLGGPLRIHVGLHTGRVAAGNIGVETYLQYATIGDATNLASRVCNVAGPGEIVLSEATRRALGADSHELEPLPPTPLKGRADELPLYRVRWSPSK
ncbi:MAG: adenylate/guanylate cyclase domain-containing protein [Polyangiaceae bacterium]